MKNLGLLIFLVLINFSCSSKKEQQYKKDILGEWIFADIKRDSSTEEPPIPLVSDPLNFVFKKNGIYICKNGYFKFFENEDRWKNKTLYLGENTKYKIDKDSLQISNPVSGTWESNKILKLNKDSLILQAKKEYSMIFIRKKKSLQYQNAHIDKIIVSNGPCFGSCPVNSNMIDSKGNFIFYGKAFNTKEGFFKATLTKKIVQEIFDQLHEINIERLETMYSTTGTDQSASTITLVSNGKIIKTVNDYGDRSPFELRRLMRNISYLYQKATLKKKDMKDPVFMNDLNSKTKQVSFINASDQFYLYTELLNAERVLNKTKTYPFIGSYTIDLPENTDYKNFIQYNRSVQTDGKIFKIELRDRKYNTLDLGYNFLERNNLFVLQNRSKSSLSARP